jgi:MFS family permease
MTSPRPAGLRSPAAIYAAGLFSMGYVDFYIFLMPLYGLSLGMTAGQVGMLVGGRSMLAVFLSIHVGTLMDRFGTRRVTLACIATAICLAPAFPLVPWFWPLLLLQVINGGALSFAWSGTQTLIALPAVATTMAIIFLRTATNGVQFSLYVVYLHGIGLSGTLIGGLFAAIETASGIGSLFAGRAMRLGDPMRTMLSGTVVSILLVCMTPFLGGVYALLAAAQIARGWLQGVVQPMMFSLQAKAVGRYRQGSVVGLRQTMNRLAAIVIPPIMGWIADGWGATESFVALGTFLLLLCLPIRRITRRAATAAADD